MRTPQIRTLIPPVFRSWQQRWPWERYKGYYIPSLSKPSGHTFKELVGEVQHPGRLVDQDEANRDERIHDAGKKAADQNLYEEGEIEIRHDLEQTPIKLYHSRRRRSNLCIRQI